MLYHNIVLQNKFCNLSPNFLLLSCIFGHSKNNLILGCIFKVVNSRYKNYVIFISQIHLSPFESIRKTDWYQRVFVFLYKFLFSGIFATLYQYSPQEKIICIFTGLVDILLDFLLLLILFYFFNVKKFLSPHLNLNLLEVYNSDFMDQFQLSQGYRAARRRQFTFYLSVLKEFLVLI